MLKSLYLVCTFVRSTSYFFESDNLKSYVKKHSQIRDTKEVIPKRSNSMRIPVFNWS